MPSYEGSQSPINLDIPIYGKTVGENLAAQADAEVNRQVIYSICSRSPKMVGLSSYLVTLPLEELSCAVGPLS